MIMFLPLQISLWLALWAIGVAVAVLSRFWAGWSFTTGAITLVVFLIAVRWIGPRLWSFGVATGLAIDFALDLAVALGYAIVLLCAKNLKDGLKFRSLHRALASFSYTIYLVHFPAMVFLAAFMKDVLDIGFARQPGVAATIYAGALLVTLYGCAWIFAALTEAHTDVIRSRLSLVILDLLSARRRLGPAKPRPG
jgi:peptidoglycan/LPS O-acetylase OafA/YrhL